MMVNFRSSICEVLEFSENKFEMIVTKFTSMLTNLINLKRFWQNLQLFLSSLSIERKTSVKNIDSRDLLREFGVHSGRVLAIASNSIDDYCSGIMKRMRSPHCLVDELHISSNVHQIFFACNSEEPDHQEHSVRPIPHVQTAKTLQRLLCLYIVHVFHSGISNSILGGKPPIQSTRTVQRFYL